MVGSGNHGAVVMKIQSIAYNSSNSKEKCIPSFVEP